MSRGLLKTAGGGRVANGLVVVNERCSISMSDGDRQRARWPNVTNVACFSSADRLKPWEFVAILGELLT